MITIFVVLLFGAGNGRLLLGLLVLLLQKLMVVVVVLDLLLVSERSRRCRRRQVVVVGPDRLVVLVLVLLLLLVACGRRRGNRLGNCSRGGARMVARLGRSSNRKRRLVVLEVRVVGVGVVVVRMVLGRVEERLAGRG